MGSTPGSYGDAAAFMTPDGKVYKIIHGKFEGSAGTASGQGAQQRRAVAAAGKAGAEGVDLSTAQQVQKMTADQVDKLRTAIGSGFVSDYTQQLREQIDAQQAANFALEYRNKLEESGMRPEFIEAQIKKAEAARLVTEQVSAADQALQILEEAGQGNTAEANRLREAIEALVKLYPQLSKAIEDNAKKQAAAADAQKQFGKQFQQTFKQAYESATNLGANLANIATNGIDGLTSAIVEFASTGKAAFKEFAASVLKDLGAMLIKFAIFSAVKGIFPGLNLGVAATGGATGPNSAAPLRKFANGGVMGSNVVPLKRYAAGGIANGPQMALFGERGPEAYVPLPDGRSIPVKVQQRSDALNRYRPINAAGTMAGDGEAGAAGGAAAP
jgi:lambda family phage tail tape measure protein